MHGDLEAYSCAGANPPMWHALQAPLCLPWMCLFQCKLPALVSQKCDCGLPLHTFLAGLAISKRGPGCLGWPEEQTLRSGLALPAQALASEAGPGVQRTRLRLAPVLLAGKLAGLDKKLSRSLDQEVQMGSSPLELSKSPVGPLAESARCGLPPLSPFVQAPWLRGSAGSLRGTTPR